MVHASKLATGKVSFPGTGVSARWALVLWMGLGASALLLACGDDASKKDQDTLTDLVSDSDLGDVDACGHITESCSVAGARCEGNSLITCAADSRGCLERTVQTCAANFTCDAEAKPPTCVADDPCALLPNRCEAEGRRCSGTRLVVCSKNPQGCLVENATECLSDTTNVCDPDATPIACALDPCSQVDNPCATAGSTCQGNLLLRCQPDPYGCLEELQLDCTTFTGGTCDRSEYPAYCATAVACSNTCAVEGRSCSGDSLVTCEIDALGCLAQARYDCTRLPGGICDDAGQVASCAIDGTSACEGKVLCDPTEPERVCATDGTQTLVECGFDADGCLVRTATDCTAVAVDGVCLEDASGSRCSQLCSDDPACPSAQAWCDANSLYVCADDNNDGCLEVTVTDCADGTCDGASSACVGVGMGTSCADAALVTGDSFALVGTDFVTDFTDVQWLQDATCSSVSGAAEAVLRIDALAGDLVTLSEHGGVDVVLSVQTDCGDGQACLLARDLAAYESAGVRIHVDADQTLWLIVETYDAAPTVLDYDVRVEVLHTLGEVEPNDDALTATAFAEGELVWATTSATPGEPDWFSFTVTSANLMTVELTDLAGGDDATLALYDANGVLIDVADVGAGLLVGGVLPAGDYTVKVEGGGAAATPLDYLLQWTTAAVSVPLEAEPNETTAEATALGATLPQAAAGTLIGNADADWYGNGATGEVVASLSGLSPLAPPSAGLACEVADATGTVVGTCALQNVPDGGFVRVSGTTDGVGASYTLTLDVGPAREREPNDTAATATPLDLDAPRDGQTMADGSDPDFFAFTKASPGIFVAEVADPGASLSLTLYAADGVLVIDEAPAADPLVVGAVLQVGTYLLEVTGAGASAVPVDYQITIREEATATGLELEPNDDASTATAISAGSPRRVGGTVAGNADWYAVDLAGGDVFMDELAPLVGPSAAITCEVYDGSAQLVGACAVTPLEAAGYVVVDGASGSQASYRLSFVAAPSVRLANAPLVAIPDNDAGGVTDTVSLATTCASLTDISVDVAITHAAPSELTVTLTAPDSTRVVLHDGSAGGVEAIGGNYPYTLTPSSSLAAFAGTDAQGDWTLTVIDGQALEVGTLDSWRLNLTCP